MPGDRDHRRDGMQFVSVATVRSWIGRSAAIIMLKLSTHEPIRRIVEMEIKAYSQKAVPPPAIVWVLHGGAAWISRRAL
jgi:hypothetical protein